MATKDNWYWCCVCQISNSGAIRKRWTFNYETKESRNEYYQKHIDWFRENNRSYYKKNKAKIYASNREWRKSHKEEWAKYQRKYEQTEKGKEVGRKKYTRRRGLNFIPLNRPFENTEAHHIDRDHVVYIPKKIHNQIHHSLSDEASMKAINSIAMLYLPKQIVKKRKRSKKRTHRNIRKVEMNEEIMRKAGFDKEVDRVKEGKCPSCGKKIDTMTEFRDELSMREHAISGLCQKCQDEVFKI